MNTILKAIKRLLGIADLEEDVSRIEAEVVDLKTHLAKLIESLGGEMDARK